LFAIILGHIVLPRKNGLLV